MKASVFVVLATALGFAACSSSNSPDAPTTPGPTTPAPADAGASVADAAADADGPLAPPAAGQGVQYEMAAMVPAGVENEWCKFVVAPAEGMWVNNEVVRYTPGSHHFLVWNTSYTSVPTEDTNGNKVDTANGAVFACPNGPNAGWNTTNIIGGSQSASAPPLAAGIPDGIAIHVPPGAVLMLNLHVLNPTADPVTSTVRINLYTIPASSVKTEAGIYFFYNPFIEVPPHASSAARMSCPVTSNITLFNGQTHMHARGLGGVANLVETATDKLIDQIYISHDWVNVPVKTWSSPTLTVTKGQSIDYQCNYQSEQDNTVYQGFDTTDEMCVFTGLYYPRDVNFEDCGAQEDNNATFIGTGTGTCASALACVATSDNSIQGLTPCIVDSCPAAGIPLTGALNCEQNAASGTCGTECSSATTACISCIESACGPQLTACENAKCD